MIKRNKLADYSYYPIYVPALEDIYQKQKKVVWQPSHITGYSSCNNDWLYKSDIYTNKYVLYILRLFSQLDGIVCDNLIENFKEETSFIKECKKFYAVQEFMEVIHNETYSLLLKSMLTTSGKDYEESLNSIENFPEIRAIADWAFKWMNKDLPLVERLIAFICIEGVIFSSAFAGIYWIKRKNIFEAVWKANEWIARDEGIHTEFGIALFHFLTEIMDEEFYDRKRYLKPSTERVHEIISSAVDVNHQLNMVAIDDKLIGMNVNDMNQYVKCTANVICESLNYPIVFNNVTNPFTWMALISMPNKTNFFESNVSEYKHHDETEFVLDADIPH